MKHNPQRADDELKVRGGDIHKELPFTSTRRRAVFKHMVEVCLIKHKLQRADEQFLGAWWRYT